MGNVGAGFSTSLDGYIAGSNDTLENPLGDGGACLFEWYGSGDTEYVMPSGGMTVKVSQESAEHLRRLHERTGALVIGRRHLDLAGAWGGSHPMDVPLFVVTHEPPDEWPYEDSPFTFVTDGVESAISQALEAADGKDVGIGGANVAKQAIRAGLVDEISIDPIPVLLGGVSFFGSLESPIQLEKVSVVESPDVTHITFRNVKQEPKPAHRRRLRGHRRC